MAIYCFQDFETQSNIDLPVTGTMRYVLDPSTRALLWSWCIDEDPVKLWCPDLSGELVPEVWAYVLSRMAAVDDCPAEIVAAMQQPGYYEIGWNEGFDRAVRQQVVTPDHGWPRLEIEQTLDAMSQAQASNLPGKLDWAGRKLGLGNKTVGGTGNMLRFARRQEPLPGSPADIDALMLKGMSRAKAIETAIAAWDLYLTYSVQDTDLLRAVWKTTRPLDAQEWQDYWTFEHINDRGMLADLDVCAGAMTYREEEAKHVVEQIKEITDGQIAGPTFTAQINKWVFERLPESLGEFMVKERDPDTGEVKRLTGDKNVMSRLIEEIQTSDTPPEDAVIDLIEVLQYGRSSSAVKFEKILNQAVVDDTPGKNRNVGRLCGSYVFNGAGQTGRGSSRGVMVHNLPRAFFKNELDLLDMIADRVPIARLRSLPLSDSPLDMRRAAEGRTSVSPILARLIRPTFIAPEGKLLVWGDWSAIEARVNPWLANSREAEKTVLEPFRNGEDLYLLNAEPIYGIPADIIKERFENGDPEAKAMRQASKVATLALGFLGSVGALKAMARSYNIRFTNEEAKRIVDGWRDRNRWARRFGDQCQDAAFAAMNNPMSLHKAGRVTYQYAPDLMGGTLVCFLPDGRPIVYAKAKIVKEEKFGKQQDTITYLNGMGFKSMWNGLQVENCTQATAASILRSTLNRLEAEETEAEVVLHTHDEVGAEVDEAKARAFADRLHSTMIRGFEWSAGLPLAAEVSTSWYYTKLA